METLRKQKTKRKDFEYCQDKENKRKHSEKETFRNK